METPYSESRVRGYPIKGNAVVEQEYSRVGLALAVFAALCFFIALWGVNGYFTAKMIRGIGTTFQIASISWGTGWLVHVVISLIEQHLWKLKEAVGNAPRFVIAGVYGLILFVGVLDVFTSALAFLVLFGTLGFPVFDPTVVIISTILAEIIAIIPEPIIVWLAVALWRVVH